MSLLAALAVTFTPGCGRNNNRTTGTTVSTPAATQPGGASQSPASGSGQSMTVVIPTSPTESVEGETGGAADSGTGTGGAVDGTVTGTDEGLPTVVYEHDEVGPCVEGMQEVTHYTEYSNGTSASSVSMQPCGISPVEE